MKKRISTKDELYFLAEEILKKEIQKKGTFSQPIFLDLRGNLGSGKTAFVQEVGRVLGIKEKINSPTFVIQKNYAIPKKSQFYKTLRKLVHVDAYRLASSAELRATGFFDILEDPQNIICLEWGERIESEVPKEAFRIELEFIDENRRDLVF